MSARVVGAQRRGLGLHMMSAHQILSEALVNDGEMKDRDWLESAEIPPEQDWTRDHVIGAMLARKNAESLENGLVDNIAEHGQSTPIHMVRIGGGGILIGNGYHRLGVAVATDPHEPLPVRVADNWDQTEDQRVDMDERGRTVPSGRHPGHPEAGPPIRFSEYKEVKRRVMEAHPEEDSR